MKRVTTTILSLIFVAGMSVGRRGELPILEEATC